VSFAAAPKSSTAFDSLISLLDPRGETRLQGLETRATLHDAEGDAHDDSNTRRFAIGAFGSCGYHLSVSQRQVVVGKTGHSDHASRRAGRGDCPWSGTSDDAPTHSHRWNSRWGWRVRLPFGCPLYSWWVLGSGPVLLWPSRTSSSQRPVVHLRALHLALVLEAIVPGEGNSAAFQLAPEDNIGLLQSGGTIQNGSPSLSLGPY
jgi:hypothetical protein